MFVAEVKPTARLERLPRGIQGTRKSVSRLVGIIHQGSRSLMVRKAAESALRDVRAHDYAGELQAIHDWVARHTRFTRDPYGTERFVEAEQILGEIMTSGTAFVDCDDYTILLGSMLKSVGFPVRVNVVGRGSYPHHIFASALAGGRWFALDPQTSYHPKWRFRENTNV